jgi:uncharacterized membrane protein required for colicin V production
MGLVLDILILFALVGGILWCMRRALARTLLGIFTLFLSTLFSALLYGPIISWFATIAGSANSGRSAGSFVFGGLLIVFDIILEFTIHRNYPDLRIRALKTWDHILGAIVGVVWAAFAVSLAIVILNFASLTFGGDAPIIPQLVTTSKLVPVFREFFKLPLLGIRPLFPQGLPEILATFVR